MLARQECVLVSDYFTLVVRSERRFLFVKKFTSVREGGKGTYRLALQKKTIILQMLIDFLFTETSFSVKHSLLLRTDAYGSMIIIYDLYLNV